MRAGISHWLTAFLLMTGPAFAGAGDDQPLPDPVAEQKARALMAEIRCLVCRGESIADSNADMAGDLRALVRQRIAAGESPRSIRRWLAVRYGDGILLRPPVKPVTWALWATPALLLVAGGLAAARLFRAGSRL